MPPPISFTNVTARGTVRRGSMVSSVRVVPASNPRNEYAAMVVPRSTRANLELVAVHDKPLPAALARAVKKLQADKRIENLRECVIAG